MPKNEYKNKQADQPAKPQKILNGIKVKMLSNAKGPGVNLDINHVYVLDSEQADAFIKAGYAAKVEEKAVDPKSENKETR